MAYLRLVCCVWVAFASGLVALPADAAMIQTADIVAIPEHLTGSGNGTLDLRMFTFSGSEILNTGGTLDADNGNNALPQGGGADISWFVESYVITAGELQAFYELNFPPELLDDIEIVLFLDLNETGGGMPHNTLAKLDVIFNPTSIQGAPDPFGDVLSGQQAAIDRVYTGGAKIAYLSPEPAANLPVNSQGAGFADYAIFTGIDPFALDDNDVLLFNVSMNTLNNGAEEVFLSGTYAGNDIPEPATVIFLALGSLTLLRSRRR